MEHFWTLYCDLAVYEVAIPKVALSIKVRALTPLFGNGAGAFRIGKNSVVLTKIGKIYNVLCIENCQTDLTYMV